MVGVGQAGEANLTQNAFAEGERGAGWNVEGTGWVVGAVLTEKIPVGGVDRCQETHGG